MKKFIFSFVILTLLTLLPMTQSAHAETVPTITILGVTQDTKVTFQTHNFPAYKVFQVRMGLLGTKGVNGILVGSLNSGVGGSLKFTCSIPADLQDESSIAIRLESTTGGYYAYNWFSNATFGTHQGGTPIDEDITPSPAVTPLSVKESELVVMRAVDFPKNQNIDIRMGKYGTEGINGILVKSVNSGDDNEFVETLEIPKELKSESKIAIRYEISSSSSIAAHSWFENQTGGSDGTGIGNISTQTQTGVPTISILSVDEDKSVSLRTYNFPAGRDFKVLMGKMGTKGVNGIHVTTIDSGSGGSFTKTFDIPNALKGDYRIAIRLQTLDGVFYAYNWFYNNTSGGSSTDSSTPVTTGIPTFSITGVVKDKTVTIKTNNFPADIDFKVLMGKMGTKGVNGIYVATINSGAGGVFSKTFHIPASLTGNDRIAIRLESTGSGFYAYNWFYNNTTP